MLRVKRVAERLSLSVSAVYALIESGALPHYKIGGAIRVSEDQLKRFLDDHEGTGNGVAQPRKRKPPRPLLRHIHLK